MARVHDRGGWPGAGPVDKSEHELSWWEKRTDAIATGVGRRINGNTADSSLL